MEWKRFEYLAAAYYERIGFRTEPIGWGADGGVDVKLFRGDLPNPVSIVQCKAWNGKAVAVSEVRELLGVMTDSKVKTGVFLTTSSFTAPAVEFAEGNLIALVDGKQFLGRILALPSDVQAELLAVACEGDWTTPSCPSCAIKLVVREGQRGRFWGCMNFPRCKYKRPMSNAVN
jgi:restriction system protein